MAEVWNSCRIWEDKKGLPKPCPINCFEPRDTPCPDCKPIIDEDEELRGNSVTFAPVVTDVFEPEPPVRRVIDTETPCSVPRSHYIKPEKLCNLCDAENATHKPNLCCSKCRPQSTSLHLNEYTNRPRPKPNYKHSVLLAPDLLYGRAFPIKFRISRPKRKCFDCGKELYFRDPVTTIDNVLVLENCCDVRVYSQKYIDNWHRVPVVSITGQENLKRKTLNEMNQIEPTTPPPSLLLEKIGSTLAEIRQSQINKQIN